MKVFVGCDHAGYSMKEAIKEFLTGQGHEVEDMGAHEYDTTDDFPDFIIPAAKRVAQDPENSRGIVFGGSGQGEAMAANKVPNIRAVVFYGPREAVESVDASGRTSTDTYEIIRLSREHNDANILSIGVRFVDEETAKKAVKLWLEFPFSEDERYARRIKKISCFEKC